mmetsp:Transcript_21806/g.60575  ORF Transcript_21806/g.60575 Transcript_21806/m.60575 type:complete len:423 (-) Transcript_21806:216-1484(-)
MRGTVVAADRVGDNGPDPGFQHRQQRFDGLVRGQGKGFRHRSEGPHTGPELLRLGCAGHESRVDALDQEALQFLCVVGSDLQVVEGGAGPGDARFDLVLVLGLVDGASVGLAAGQCPTDRPKDSGGSLQESLPGLEGVDPELLGAADEVLGQNVPEASGYVVGHGRGRPGVSGGKGTLCPPACRVERGLDDGGLEGSLHGGWWDRSSRRGKRRSRLAPQRAVLAGIFGGDRKGPLHGCQQQAGLDRGVVPTDLGQLFLELGVGREDLERNVLAFRIIVVDVVVVVVVATIVVVTVAVVVIVLGFVRRLLRLHPRRPLSSLPLYPSFLLLGPEPELPRLVDLPAGVQEEPRVGLGVLQTQDGFLHGRVHVRQAANLGRKSGVVGRLLRSKGGLRDQKRLERAVDAQGIPCRAAELFSGDVGIE